MRTRLEYIDMMRGIILLVVIGHIIQFNNGPLDNPIFEFIYSFHMPLFFFISGYIAQKTVHIHQVTHLIPFILKKARALLIPMFVWQLFASKLFLTDEWITFDNINPLYVWNNPSLWFLKDLFLIFIIYSVYNLIIESYKLKNKLLLESLALVSSLLLFGILSFFDIASFKIIIYIYPFYLGNYVSRFPDLERKLTGEISFAVFFFTFVIIVCHWNFGGNMYDDILKVAISTFASIIALTLSQKMHINNYLRCALIRYGNKSLSIYIIQFFLTVHLTGAEYLLTMNPFVAFSIYAIIAVLIAEICCIADSVISQSKYSRLILLGKK